jgi:hypothetical protein
VSALAARNRPETGDDLSAGEERVTLLVLSVYLLNEVALISLALGSEPVSEHLDLAIQRHVLCNDEFAHCRSQILVGCRPGT